MNQKVTESVKQNILNNILQDLEPPALTVHTKVAIATILGGILSLLVCGQFSFGLTGFATVLNHKMHEQMGPFVCALICGGLYAVFPVMILRFFLCHPLQFRVFMHRKWPVLMLWFVGFGVILAEVGHHEGNSILILAAWLTGAIVAANVLTHVIYKVVPSLDFHLRFKKSKHV